MAYITHLPGFFELGEELFDVFDEIGDEVDVPGVLFEVVRDEVQLHVQQATPDS